MLANDFIVRIYNLYSADIFFELSDILYPRGIRICISASLFIIEEMYAKRRGRSSLRRS